MKQNRITKPICVPKKHPNAIIHIDCIVHIKHPPKEFITITCTRGIGDDYHEE